MAKFNITTPAGFAINLVHELHKLGRISSADKQVLELVIMPIAQREASMVADRTWLTHDLHDAK